MPETKWVTSEQAAKLLGVTPRHVAWLVSTGKLPGATKVNPEGETSPYIIPLDEVKALIKKRKTGPLGK